MGPLEHVPTAWQLDAIEIDRPAQCWRQASKERQDASDGTLHDVSTGRKGNERTPFLYAMTRRTSKRVAMQQSYPCGVTEDAT